jgi:hypothetical protein
MTSTCLARCQRHALRGVPGANGPNSPPPLLLRYEAHGVVRAPNLERSNRLEAFELQVDLGRPIVIQPHHRRADRRLVNMLPRVIDHPFGNQAFLCDVSGHEIR